MVALATPAGSGLPPRWRVPLMLLGFLCLVAGVSGGLARVGFGTAPIESPLIWKGGRRVLVFFGGVLSRAYTGALDRAWAYLAPLACGIGGIALLAGAGAAGLWLFVAGAAILLAASLVFAWRQPSLEVCTLAIAAGSLLAGNVLLALGAPLAIVLGWWLAFFALTIGAERLELSRYMPRPRAAHWLFAAIALALIAGAFASLRLTGLALVALAGWLFAFDLARKTIRGTGLVRYIAACLLAGYTWLALGGALFAIDGAYDSAVHAVLVGFVFSMVFGHAPVIVPAVLRRALPYTAWFYVPLALLHSSLALRVAGGLAGDSAARAAGSAGNALAIALFVVLAASQAVRGTRT